MGIRAQHCSFSFFFFFFSSNNPSVKLVPHYFSSQPLFQAGEESGERGGKEKRKAPQQSHSFPAREASPGAPKVSAEEGNGRQAGAGSEVEGSGVG